MVFVKLIIQYDGTDFAGYELQPGKRTVRGEIEKALLKIFKHKISIRAVSRTDAGVHALGNVINFKVKTSIPTARIVAALNSLLSEDIRAMKVISGKLKVESRRKVKSKTYEYFIYNGNILPPLYRRFVWRVKPKLNLAAMKKAAKYLIGKHDFSSFCSAGGGDRNFVKILHALDIGNWTLSRFHIGYDDSGSRSAGDIWSGQKFPVVSCRITANGFLYKMVRNIVGTLVDVGLGKIAPEEVKKILQAKDRTCAGRCAPPQGLCLVSIHYR